jgi:hypothetical protein
MLSVILAVLRGAGSGSQTLERCSWKVLSMMRYGISVCVARGGDGVDVLPPELIRTILNL